MARRSQPVVPNVGNRAYEVLKPGPDATIVLVGFPGAGKKTLGIMASVALRRRFINFEELFREHHSLSPQTYIATYGLPQYRQVEEQLSKETLQEFQEGCLIVGLGGVAAPRQRTLLKDFSQHNPVLYIRREQAVLEKFVTTSKDKFERFHDVGNVFFEDCSNFEFFNISRDQGPSTRQLPSNLKLKETERVFLQFINHILGNPDYPSFSSDPLSPSHTFSLQVPISWLDSRQDWTKLDAGADAITLIIDIDTVERAKLQSRLAQYVAILRLHSRAPVVLDLNTPSDAPELYSQLFQILLRLAPDAVTCPLGCDLDTIHALNTTKGRTKTIATYHQTRPLGLIQGSQEISTLPAKAQNLGFDAIRLTGESVLTEDNLACLALRQEMAAAANISVIMYNLGVLGRTSVCLNPTLSPVVLPNSDAIGVSVPEAQRALTACFLSPRKRFTIVGQAAAQSLSPAMHNSAYSFCGLPHVYDTLQADTLSHIHPLLDGENQGGLAISLPYKTDILSLLDDISPDARDINAVNTVVLERQYQPDGSETTSRKGYNTDYIGIKHCIQKHLSPANAIREGTTALILGAGGMARAAVYACYQLGIRRICLYNRTVDNARKVVDYYHRWAELNKTNLHLKVIESPTDAWPAGLRLPTAVISCLPAEEVGSHSPIDICIHDDWLRSLTGGVFLEVAYATRKTPLLERMLKRESTGWIVVDGLSLLLEQGTAQYELFTKRPAPVHVMRRAIHEEATKYGASLGRAWHHDLHHKITQAATAGFRGLEIFYEDLEYAAQKIKLSRGSPPGPESEPSEEDILAAAAQVSLLCRELGIRIIGLQPFLFYEGLKDRRRHAELIRKMRFWFRIAKTLGTETIQIPANFLPAEELVCDDDNQIEVIVSDLREVAEMGAAERPVIRFAYENLCWSTYIDTIEKAWEIVKRVDRDNFGLCLDTFNIAGRAWGDPASLDGKAADAESALDHAIATIVNEIDVSKVFYIQVVDAERMRSPLVAGHAFYVEGQPARMSWSRNARTFVYEEGRGAYLPVERVARAIVEGLGYQGFVSMELFSRTLNEEGEGVPGEHSRRGIRAWEILRERLQLQ
ncbi:xylose isomerase-like protein [Aspergillus crustosus]